MDSNKVGFGIITVIQVPTVLCALQILIRFTQKTSAFRRLQNRTLILLLIVALWTIIIELPHTQKYLWTGSVTIYQHWFCVVYNISFFSNATLNRMLMAFMSIERHFLIFRPQLYRTKRSRFLLHTVPLLLICSFTTLYNILTTLLAKCVYSGFNYSSFQCGYTCGILNTQFGLIYAWILVFLPVSITVVACILLPMRFILQRQQLQRVEWARARKMIVQMSIICSAYTICWLPYTILLQLLLNGILSFTNIVYTRFLSYTPYVTSLLTPWIVLQTSPEWFAFKKRAINEIPLSQNRTLPQHQQSTRRPVDAPRPACRLLKFRTIDPMKTVVTVST